MTKRTYSRFFSALATGVICLFFSVTAYAEPPKNIQPKTNFGVQCINCKQYDYMEYMGYEQVGIGGTLHRLYYRCTFCGAVTTVDLQAR